MSSSPDYLQTLSLKVSEVLDEIGVNPKVIIKRRRTSMRNETLLKIEQELKVHTEIKYLFGSQTEGCTTDGLKSDIDTVQCSTRCRIIQKESEWRSMSADVIQLLMIHDDKTYPGHCRLLLVSNSVPIPAGKFQHEYFKTDSRGLCFARHYLCLRDIPEGLEIHGPAVSSTHSDPLRFDTDVVRALRCLSWPEEAEQWLREKTPSGWPTEDVKSFAKQTGCLVVPVASKTGVYPDTEWRISTVEAERCLMFNLNIVQIRCYVLMKMIVKTHIRPVCGDVVSSYICKTVLFQLTSKLHAHMWSDSNMLSCFLKYTEALRDCIVTEHCPHFFISGNNLLDNRLSVEAKRQIVDILRDLTENVEHYLHQVSSDSFGIRLKTKEQGGFTSFSDISVASHYIALGLVDSTLTFVFRVHICLERLASVNVDLFRYILQLFWLDKNGTLLQKSACRLMVPLLCTSLACRLASSDIQSHCSLSAEAVTWFSLGIGSDIASSSLKLASALYCTENLQNCEVVLTHLLQKCKEKNAATSCQCYIFGNVYSFEFGRICDQIDDEIEVIKRNTAFCVRFTRSEMHCVPVEMKYEFFKSKQQEQNRNVLLDFAVVDSPPFLHFLLYKLFSRLQRPAEQHAALVNLARTVDIAGNLGHRETALNILGQCMEKSYVLKPDEALKCYQRSLKIRAKNNAANWLACCLLAKEYRRRKNRVWTEIKVSWV